MGKYTKILVTKLEPLLHEKFTEIAKRERRTLSSLCRIIIEDYVHNMNIESKQEEDQYEEVK